MKRFYFLISICFMLMLVPRCVCASDIFSNYIVMDMESGRVFYEKASDEKRLPASTTKIMTLVVGLENSNLSDVVRVGDEILTMDGSNIYVEIGENILMQDLMYGMILRSGNDASMVIAKNAGGTVDNFVKLMNEKARSLGLKNTVFNNPSGLDDYEKNITTVRDLSLIYRYGYRNKIFRDIVGSKTYSSSSDKKSYYFVNRSKIINMDKRITGAKTGYTPDAGRVLVSSASNGDLDVVISSISKIDYGYGEHINFYNSVFSKYRKYMILDKYHFDVNSNFKGKLYIKDSFSYPVSSEEKDKIDKKIVYNGKKDGVVGEVLVYLDSDLIHKEKLYLKKDKINFFDRIKAFFGV